jgi:cell division septum initiation protein DivIVA
MVDPDRLNKVGEQLRSSVPADIQEAKEVITQKESVVNQAYLEARRIKEEAEATVAAARQEQESRIDQTEIMKAAEAKAEETNQNALQEGQEIVQDAQRRAYRIIDEAEAGATTRREGSDQYARETLFELEERLSGLLGQVRRGIDALGLEVEVKIPAGATNGT